MIFSDDVRDWLRQSNSACCPKCDGYGRQVDRWDTGEIINKEWHQIQVVVYGQYFTRPYAIDIHKVIVTRICYDCDALFWHECDDSLPF